MRTTQRARYAERIDRVIRHLESHDWDSDSKTPDLDQLSALAAMSPFHFHRIFRIMTGETVGDVVRRVRLARSIAAIKSGTGTITEAAMESGYATSQSFARAIKSASQLTASDARRSATALRAIEDQLRRRTVKTDEGALPLSIEVVTLEPFTLVAMRNVGAYAELNNGYDKLFGSVFATLPMDSLRGIYGVPLDDPASVADTQCRFDCALLVDGEVPMAAGTRPLELGGGAFLRYRHIGDFDAIYAKIDALVTAVLDTSDFQIADAPIHIHYLDEPESGPAETLRSDIFLPVEWESGDA
jgi:AraC family transcriptional regulator